MRSEAVQALQDAWDTINRMVVPGPLQGDGWDKTAERNGLIMAANVLFAAISREQEKPAADAVVTIRMWRDSPKLAMVATCNGRFDSSYAAVLHTQLVEVDIPKLLLELREQLQRSSGSTVTE